MKTQLPYERVKISSLILDPDNAREHDERNLSVIKESLKRFEQQRTIVVSKDNIVIAGNGTVMAAKQLGWETIDITRSQLTGEEAKAFALVDNRSTDLSKYDDDKLREQLAELEAAGVDMTALGWTDEEMNMLKVPDFEPGDLDDQSKLDEKKKAECPECGHVFTP
jgi:ParB-like chromosome segregation protein Spo0J